MTARNHSRKQLNNVLTLGSKEPLSRVQELVGLYILVHRTQKFPFPVANVQITFANG